MVARDRVGLSAGALGRPEGGLMGGGFGNSRVLGAHASKTKS